MKLMKLFTKFSLATALLGLASTAAYAYPIYGSVYIGGWGVPYYAHVYYGAPYYRGPFYRPAYFPYHSNYNYHYHYVYNYNYDGQHYHYVYNYNVHFHNRW